MFQTVCTSGISPRKSAEVLPLFFTASVRTVGLMMPIQRHNTHCNISESIMSSIQLHIKRNSLRYLHSVFTGCLWSQGDVVTAVSGVKRAVQVTEWRELSTFPCSQEFTAAYSEGRGGFGGCRWAVCHSGQSPSVILAMFEPLTINTSVSHSTKFQH